MFLLPSTRSDKPRLAYLVSQLPALSHTFILREIMALRERGFDILPISVNAADRPHAELGMAEQILSKTTVVLKRSSPATILQAVTHALLRHPQGCLKALATLPAQAGWDAGAWLRQLAYLGEAILTGHAMAQQGIRHLHVHFATPAASVGLLCKALYGISLSLTVHGPDEFSHVRHYRLAEKMAAADFVVCISEFCRSQLMLAADPADWPKFQVIPLGVDAVPPRPLPQNRPLHLFSIGRLAPAKGQLLLLDAFAELCHKHPDSHLTLIGSGPLLPQLQQRIDELHLHRHVTLTGGLGHDDTLALLHHADIFVMASFAEGVPVVLMEAMMRGIPCIATRIAGIPELIQDGESGLLCAPGDSQSLSQAMQLLAEDKRLRYKLAAAARIRVLARYHIEHNADRLAGLFRRQLQHAPTLMPDTTTPSQERSA